MYVIHIKAHRNSHNRGVHYRAIMSALPEIGLNVIGTPGSLLPWDAAEWTEQQGFASVWLTDGGGHLDALTSAAAIAARTERVRIGLSIVPVFTRPAAVLANSINALSHLAPGRVVVGLGSSSQTMIENWYGVPFEKPLTRVKETVMLLKQILAGGKTDFSGQSVQSRNFRLARPPKGEITIFLAALRPKMLELAGELADGVVLNLAPAEILPRMLEHLDTGAKRSGRRVDDLEIASLLNVIVTDRREEGIAAMKKIALGYYSTGVYNQFLSWMGYDEQARQIREGFAERDREKTGAAVSPELVAKLGVIGTAGECRSHLAAYAANGLNTAIVNVMAGDDEDDYKAAAKSLLDIG